ncbi:MAG: alkaline phosphatase family protein [Candidatus Eremiobacteraeota bacterium]|nr:alkaline phosphatase family protein [Candidatus Eremiobacteraeota bacterium]
MRRAVVLISLGLLLAVAAGVWYLRSSKTRLIPVPLGNPIAAAVSAVVKPLPRAPRSVIVVIEENKSYEQIFSESDKAPYLNSLAKTGAVFTHSYGIAHPSQPNYFALFSGQADSNGDQCAATGIANDADNLGAEAIAAHRTFRAYAEDLPSPGFAGCTSGQYARKHAPWTHFTNVPPKFALPFSALASYDALPTVSFVIPNLVHDMHSASVVAGDTWLREKIGPLIAWAGKHDALVIITWDESSAPIANHIPTLFLGPMVVPGKYDEVISHYRVLRTIEDLYGFGHAGAAALAAPIRDCWKPKS